MENFETRHQEYPLPAGFREPSDGSVRYFPWGAMPTNIYRDDEKPLTRTLQLLDKRHEPRIKRRQKMIQTELQKLYEMPPAGIPEDFAELVATDTFIGEQRRAMNNHMSYMRMLGKNAVWAPATAKAARHMEDGTATVDEILDVALDTELETFELGKVTHPYRRRFEYVEPFRAEVNQAILAHDGNVLPSLMTPYRNVDVVPYTAQNELVPRGIEFSGIIARYKRDVGVINRESDRVRIVERQLAGFRVDEASGFDQEIFREMRAALPANDEKKELAEVAKKDGELYIEMWRRMGRRILDETGCRAYIEDKIQNNSLEPFVVPLSTTIYGYKEPIVKQRVGRNFVARNGEETNMLLSD